MSKSIEQRAREYYKAMTEEMMSCERDTSPSAEVIRGLDEVFTELGTLVNFFESDGWPYETEIAKMRANEDTLYCIEESIKDLVWLKKRIFGEQND